MPPPKKRKFSVSTDGSVGDDASPAPTPKIKRRKKPTIQYDPLEFCQELYDTIRNHKTEDGRLLCEPFIRVPKRRTDPEYYDVVTLPIDLLRIQHKLKSEEYDEIEQLTSDIELMVNNAKAFYKPESQEYQDACDLWDLYSDTKNILIAEAFGDTTDKESLQNKDTVQSEKEDAGTLKKIVQNRKTELETGRQRSARRSARRNAPPTQRLSAICAALTYDEEDESDVNSLPEGEVSTPIDMDEESMTDNGSQLCDETSPEWVLYNTVIYHKNTAGQLIAEPFTRLPSKRIYPDYYEEIKKPLSLLNVSKKLKHNQYRSLDVLATDLELVFENAKQYNMDESKLYLDAVTLQNILRVKKKELALIVKEEVVTTPSVKARRNDSEERKTPKRKSLTTEDVLRKRLNILYKTVLEHLVDGRSLVDIFVVLPSKKDYPDYYHVISEPIDMSIIEAKIKTDKYTGDQALIADFELMFNNARHYNEEDSQVYRDADSLEKVLKRKLSQLVPLDSPRAPKVKGKTPKSKGNLSPLEQKLNDLYNTIKDYADTRGRTLSTPFIKLPLRNEYPDYYEVIKRPIDMLKVHQRMAGKLYETMEDMVADFVLIFDNACKYNEPDSLIYKDALTLQRVCLEKKAEICTDDDVNEVPDVKAMVQEMMTSLYIAMYNHTDEDGRSYSDSFQDMPVPANSTTQTEGQETPRRRAPSFEQVKKNLDRSRYRRFDRFQEDIFEVFDYARRVSRTDSQLYEDAVELQMFFIKRRDEITKNGEILLTPALSYMEKHLQISIDEEKKEKLPNEQKEDEEKRKQQEAETKQKEEDAMDTGSNVDSDMIEHNNMNFTLGDFVYLEPREKNIQPHIICIEKMWRSESGEAFLYGNFYHRPHETYHVATKKFLEKEVFKSDLYEDMPFTRVIGKCFVMFVKDYFKMRPDLIPDKDVYVCESRYSSRQRAFKKIKIWQVPRHDVRLIARDMPLQPVRVASVFAEKVEELEEENDEPLILEKEREVLEIEKETDNTEGCLYYEQYKTPAGWFKLGDCVYVRSEEDKPYIAMIDKIWTDQSGSAFFHGPWFVHPIEVEHSPTRLFYKREVFRSSIEDTNPMLSIQGKCAVLVHKDYCNSRPTEILEPDVYICESKYMEAEKSIRKLAKSMKKPVLSPKVCDDEIYFFKKGIVPQKEPSPLLQKATEEPYVEEVEEDTSRPESAENTTFAFREELSLDSIPDITPKEKKKVPKTPKSAKPWQPSGYLVFSAESRKQVQEDNPDLTFGDISKVVGSKWRELPKEEKVRYEEKAKKLAEEHAAKQEAADKAFNTSLALFPPASSPTAEASRSPATAPTPARTLTLTPGPHTTPVFQNQFQQTPQGTSQQQAPAPPPRPPSPMFVSVPPRTQRLLHSEAYLRYIEGIGKDDNSVGPWERSLTATPENTPLDRHAKLPVSWLGQGVGHHDNTVRALWALRDLLMKDTLSIDRTLEFTQL